MWLGGHRADDDALQLLVQVLGVVLVRVVELRQQLLEHRACTCNSAGDNVVRCAVSLQAKVLPSSSLRKNADSWSIVIQKARTVDVAVHLFGLVLEQVELFVDLPTERRQALQNWVALQCSQAVSITVQTSQRCSLQASVSDRSKQHSGKHTEHTMCDASFCTSNARTWKSLLCCSSCSSTTWPPCANWTKPA